MLINPPCSASHWSRRGLSRRSSHPSQSIAESLTKPQHNNTCTKSSFSGAFLLHNWHLRLVLLSSSLESYLTVRIKVEKSNNGVSTKGQKRFRAVTSAYYGGAVGALLVYNISRLFRALEDGLTSCTITQSDVNIVTFFCLVVTGYYILSAIWCVTFFGGALFLLLDSTETPS